MIKSSNKDSTVVGWHREDYIKETEKQLGDEQIYEEISNEAAPLLETINEVIVVTIVVTIMKILPYFWTIIYNH